MHFAVEAHALQDVAPVGFERAAVVVQADPRDAGNQPVGNHGGQPPVNPGVFAVLAPAGNHRRAILFHFFEQQGDVRRVVLQIGVQCDDDVLLGCVNAGGHCRRLAEVAAEANEMKARMLSRRLLKALPRFVVGAVIHQNDFIVAPAGGEGVVQFLGQRRDVGFFVEYGNYDRKAGAVCHARSMREGVDDFKEGFAANGGEGRRRSNQFFLAVPFAGAAQAFVQPDFRVIAEVTLGLVDVECAICRYQSTRREIGGVMRSGVQTFSHTWPAMMTGQMG